MTFINVVFVACFRQHINTNCHGVYGISSVHCSTFLAVVLTIIKFHYNLSILTIVDNKFIHIHFFSFRFTVA